MTPTPYPEHFLPGHPER